MSQAYVIWDVFVVVYGTCQNCMKSLEKLLIALRDNIYSAIRSWTRWLTALEENQVSTDSKFW